MPYDTNDSMFRGYSGPPMSVEDLYYFILSMKINNADLEDASVDYAKIAHASIGEVHIREAAINNAMIQNLAVSRAKIEDAAIDTAKIEDLSVTAAKIGNLAVTTAKIDDLSVTHAKIASAAIDTANIKVGAITTALIATGAIETAQIADGSITDAKIVELTANKITAGILDVERLRITGPGSILYEINVNNVGELTASELTLDGGSITERSITADRIVAEAITAREIAAKTITANEIAANTITVNSGIIANAAITNAMIVDATITNAKIANATIESAKIASIDAGKITTGTLQAIKIDGVTITGSVLNLKFGVHTVGMSGEGLSMQGASSGVPHDILLSAVGTSAELLMEKNKGKSNYEYAHLTPLALTFGRATGNVSSRIGIASNGDLDLGSINVGSLSGTSAGRAVRIQTSSGYLDIGPQNTSYSHIYTDLPTFIFNKPIRIVGGALTSHTGDLLLQTAGTTRLTVGTNGDLTTAGLLQVGANMRVQSASGFLALTASGGILHLRSNTEVNVTTTNAGAFVPIRALSFPTGSSARYKTNIKLIDHDVIAMLKDVSIYTYHLQSNIDALIFDKPKIGMISEATLPIFRDEDGVDPYTITAFLFNVCQVQQTQIESLEARISDLEMVA